MCVCMCLHVCACGCVCMCVRACVGSPSRVCVILVICSFYGAFYGSHYVLFATPMA